MGENTKIAWCDHTCNPVRWGPSGTRVVADESAWKQVERWDTIAKITSPAGVNHFNKSVFCGSMCDVFEDWQGEIRDSRGRLVNPANWQPIESEGPLPATMSDVRTRVFNLIDATRLTWLLLTKRPENIRRMIPSYFPGGYIAEAGAMNQEGPRDNLWLGTAIACQEDADKNIPELLRCRDLCAGLFLSIEPLIGPVDLRDLCIHESRETCGLGGTYMSPPHAGIDQVIIGGESGPHARPCNVEWIRSIARQCESSGVPCFVRQLGSHVIGSENERHEMCGICIDRRPGTDEIIRWKLRDKKGGDPDEWPEDLRKYRKLAWKGGAA